MSLKKDKLTVGCIGCGNMGGAILQGLSAFAKCNLIGSDPCVTCLNDLQSKGVKSAKDIPQLIDKSDIIIIAVKPGLVETVASKMLNNLTENKIVVSVAAGVTLEKLKNVFQNKCPVVRCMPTITAGVGNGVYAFNFDDPMLSPKKQESIIRLFESIGMCIELQERYFSAFTALIGAGPGYVFHLVNALVQAGVSLGFSRNDAARMVNTLCDGSLRMAKESDSNLLDLRDQVCSPAGITIEGINHMERMGVNGHIVDAILAANERGEEMEKG